jgi:hypothetical protein
MNISATNISSECELKCALSFDYNTSNSCVVTNGGNTLTCSYDMGKIPPVVYNGNKYIVSEIAISYSSWLLYNKNKADAEIYIGHRSDTAPNMLGIFIPISTSSSVSTTASNIITQIINDVSKTAPATGNTTTVPIKAYNLNNIVPNKPFYSFTLATESLDCIVFGIDNAITITPATLDIFKKLANGKKSPISNINAPLSYNPKGPVVGDLSDQIYIDCQPVNSSNETVNIDGDGNFASGLSTPKIKPPVVNDAMTLRELIYFIIFLVVLSIVAMYYAVQYLLQMADVKVTSPLTSRLGKG